MSLATICESLAARIPWRMTSHLSIDRCHSMLAVCEDLGVVREQHHKGKVREARLGWYVPSKHKNAFSKLYYRLGDHNKPDAPDWPTMAALLIDCPDIRRKARKLYPKTK